MSPDSLVEGSPGRSTVGALLYGLALGVIWAAGAVSWSVALWQLSRGHTNTWISFNGRAWWILYDLVLMTALWGTLVLLAGAARSRASQENRWPLLAVMCVLLAAMGLGWGLWVWAFPWL